MKEGESLLQYGDSRLLSVHTSCQIVRDSLHSPFMDPGSFRAKIADIRSLTNTVREFVLTFQHPPYLNFLAGQSLAILVPETSRGTPTKRYYSLTSHPNSPARVSLLLNGADKGKGTKFLLDHKIGDELDVAGPFGNFQLHDHPDRDVLFVATGTGIAPFRAMIHVLLEKPFQRALTLYWGLRSEGDQYFIEEFQALSRRHTNFTFSVVLSNASPQWGGRTGRVTDLIRGISNVRDLAIYICGNRNMVHEVQELLRGKGSCPIYHE